MLLVSKLLALFVYPLSFFFILVIVSIVLRRRLASRSANALRLLAVAWLYFCATEWGASLLLAPLERGYPAVETDALPVAEAIVVLGGAMTNKSRFGLGGDLNASADRLWHSAALFSAGKAPIMVLSGGAGLGQSTTEAELMLGALRAIGIDGAIELETQSQTTRENAYFTGKLLNAHGITHILLVTSAAHMRRAMPLFQAQGLLVTPAATDHQTPLHVGAIPGWLPTTERLARSTRALHEWVGYWIYERLGHFEMAAITEN